MSAWFLDNELSTCFLAYIIPSHCSVFSCTYSNYKVDLIFSTI